MRIAAQQTVSAPPHAVFERLADFEMFEIRARRRNIPVERVDDSPPAWRIGVDWAGMSHRVDLRVVSVIPPEGYEARVATRGVSGGAVIEIAPKPTGSLLAVTLDLAGQGMGGRMIMQTLTFAQTALEARLTGALAKLAAEIEAERTRAD